MKTLSMLALFAVLFCGCRAEPTMYEEMIDASKLFIKRPLTEDVQKQWLRFVHAMFPIGTSRGDVARLMAAAPPSFRLIESDIAKRRMIIKIKPDAAGRTSIHLRLLLDTSDRIAGYDWSFDSAPEEYYPPPPAGGGE